MASIFDAIFYILIFLSVYVQVFFFVTFLENRDRILIRKGKTNPGYFPAVTIVVPCWNEEKTVEKTVQSLLGLNYPKDKLKIFLINDGSTDNTKEAINKFLGYENIKIFHKENGGKFTALNLGLEKSNTEFFGCLDADSFVHPESLARIMTYFKEDKNTMAVAPAVVVNESRNIIQSAQRAEYNMGLFFKKMLGFLGAINVTPGPFTIFRKKVFNDLGPYKHAHNTEDMEIAFRMQKHNYKIENCNDAFVYTNTPGNVKKLYKQRLRWIYGFINNTIDYRGVLFKGKYGNFALFTLPTGVVSIFAVSFLFGRIAYNAFHFIYIKMIEFSMVGLSINVSKPSFDPFFINTQSSLFLMIMVYSLIIFALLFGRKMSQAKSVFSWDTIVFFPVFGLVAPFWILKAILNTILSRKPSWR